jgi:hypothetical protein
VLFLRDGGARGGKEEDGEEANDRAHHQQRRDSLATSDIGQA